MAVVEKNPTIQPDNNLYRGRSKFPFQHHVAGTYRFGEVAPFAVASVINGDKFPWHSVHDLRSYTLKAPLMNGLKMDKHFYQVPYEAILPLNWELVYKNPKIGSDVNPKEVNCILSWTSISLFFSKTSDAIIDLEDQSSQNYDIEKASTLFIKYLVAFERFFSNGCLLASLGCNLAGYTKNLHVSGVAYKDFDAYFDAVCSLMRNSLATGFQVKFGNDVFIVTSSDITNSNVLTFRQFMEKIRDDNSWSFVDSVTYPLPSVFSKGMYIPFSNDPNFEFGDDLNLSFPLAYQLICAEFFTNDNVDYIYSANLYRQNIKNLYVLESDIDSNPYGDFTWNGISKPFDYLSGACMNSLLDYASANYSDYDTLDGFNIVFDFFRLTLGFNRSLRYVDYFTGSRTRPLAVGDVDVNVSANKVNVIDVTRNIQRQKFFNWVNKTAGKFENYVSKLGGKYVDTDYHNPLYLGSASDAVNSYQIENTGSAQLTEANSITSIFRANGGKYMFDIEFDRPSVLIGVVSFDLTRYYRWNVDKFFFHYDRFDMFNPFLQFTGDQPVMRQEFSSCFNRYAYDGEIFGYTNRYEEYKQKPNMCFGGFAAGLLPGFQYIADETINVSETLHVSPDYIRSRNSELDPFYTSLTGDSLGSYWHFIIDFYNDVEPIRPMAFNPQILG